jgi:hypothetical protein
MASIWATIREETIKPWKEQWISRHPGDIGLATWNAIFSGGKEIRPALLCELWTHLSPGTPIIGDLAFAVECIHCASLILDDTPMMDNAATRRSRPTIHKAYSLYKALWLAFEIMTIVFDIWSKHAPAEEAEAAIWWNFLRDKLLQLCIGQYYDLTGTGDLHLLAILKTGSLFEFSTELVALKLGLSKDAWRTWGRQLGVLFQWADDWNDREEDALAGNRNAFSEAADTVCQHYQILLERSNIGDKWRERPFGNWLMTYFEKNGPPLVAAANSTIANIPAIFISEKPHAEFITNLNISNIIATLYKRFTLYFVPSKLIVTLFNHYSPQIPELFKAVTHTHPSQLLRVAIQLKDTISKKTGAIWNKLTDTEGEETIRQEVLKYLQSKGINHDQPHLLQAYVVLLS